MGGETGHNAAVDKCCADKAPALAGLRPRWQQTFFMSMLQSVLAVSLFALLGGGFTHAEDADLTYSAFDATSIEQAAQQRSADVHAAAGDCVIVCPGAACIASMPTALHLQVALTQPSTSLAPEVAKHLRAPDTAPPKASFV